MQNVLLAFGGKSSEHEVSIVSGSTVFTTFPRDEYNPIPVYIDKAGAWFCTKDVVETIPKKEDEVKKIFTEPVLITDLIKKYSITTIYPIVHGGQGEDGVLQGLARVYGLRFAGPSMETAFATFDKDITKLLAERAGVQVAPWIVWMKGEAYPPYTETIQKLGNLLFVKPSRSGSSVGVSKVTKEEDFIKALDFAGAEDSKVLIESGVSGREVEVAIFVPPTGEPMIANKVGEIKPPEDSFYSYEEKYASESNTGLVVDTQLTDTERSAIVDAVHKVIKGVNIIGTSRVDFFLTPEGVPVLNEVNTIPGNTSISMYPKLFEASGTPPTELIRMILKNAK